MAEGRMLKRKITKSKKLAQLKTDKARLLWFYMLPFTDVDGRIVADPEDIKEEIIRKQRKGFTITKIEECLQDQHRVGLIVLYTVNNKRYLEFTRFWNEQSHNRDREAESDIPPPTQGVLTECSQSNPLKLSKVKLSKDKEYTSAFLDFWNKYPYRLSESNERVPKAGKHLAWQQWYKLSEEVRTEILRKVVIFRSSKIVPDAWRWLRDKKWEDLPEPRPQIDQEQVLRRKQDEIRREEGKILRGYTIEKLKALLTDPQWTERHFLIQEIIEEKGKAK